MLLTVFARTAGALRPAVTRMGSGGQGTLFLVPSPLIVLVVGTLPPSGTAVVLSGVLPPAAAGLTARMQALQKASGAPHRTNLERVQALP